MTEQLPAGCASDQEVNFLRGRSQETIERIISRIDHERGLREKAEREIAEFREIHDETADLVDPGTIDSVDAYRIVLNKARRDRDEYFRKLAEVSTELGKMKAELDDLMAQNQGKQTLLGTVIRERDEAREEAERLREILGSLPMTHHEGCRLDFTKNKDFGEWLCVDECPSKIIHEALRSPAGNGGG